MSQIETDRTGTEQAARSAGASHALVPFQRDAEKPVLTGSKLGRPSAGFLAQLIVSCEPELRPSRNDRTRVAVALYAETARRSA